jgi:hypothetical protein
MGFWQSSLENMELTLRDDLKRPPIDRVEAQASVLIP